MTEHTAAIVRAAINMAKSTPGITLAQLRKRLEGLYPYNKNEVNEALLFWANREKQLSNA